MAHELVKVWELLNDVEDCLNGGYRKNHPPVEVVASEGDDPLETVAKEVRSCTRCGLCNGRNKAVPGTGASDPVVMVIGEGPGAEEDRLGLPFVGPAGRYLDKWLEAIDLSRDRNCFIANVVKCRPPGNRDPHPEESDACVPFLTRQIEILKPRAILSVGRIATQILLGTTRGIGATRGQVYSYKGIPLVATYHPSGVLRNPEYRRPVWDDLQVLKNLIDSGHR